ncbi:MAG: hypothetical protein HRT47_04645 [Candidatus Caenarcaniphilales bacterium]|nr:hypothetical protein [Candidatus Caenarcaniphilales bacterium]
MNTNVAIISGLENADGSKPLTSEQQEKIKLALQNLSEASHTAITSDDPKQNLANTNTRLIMNSLNALNSVLVHVANGNIKNPDHLSPLINKINERAENLPKGIAEGDDKKTMVRA